MFQDNDFKKFFFTPVCGFTIATFKFKFVISENLIEIVD